MGIYGFIRLDFIPIICAMWNKSVSRINYIFVKAECGKFVETINVIYDDDDDNATIVFSESINSIF